MLTEENYDEFVLLYLNAKRNNEDQFTFEGNAMDTKYAGFLIQYVKNEK